MSRMTRSSAFADVSISILLIFFIMKTSKLSLNTLAALCCLVLFTTSCQDDVAADLAPSGVRVDEATLLDNVTPDGQLPSISLLSPTPSSFLSSPISFSVENTNDAQEAVVVTEYYFKRRNAQIATRDENIFLGSAPGTEPFIYEGPISPLVAARFGTRAVGAVSIDDDGEADVIFNDIIPNSEVEVIASQSVRDAIPEGGASVKTFAGNRLSSGLALGLVALEHPLHLR